MSHTSISHAVLLGSARKQGETRKAVDVLFSQHSTDIIDLLDYDIAHYDYEHTNQSDDFIRLAERLVGYSHIVLATPVYWYAMSGVMKVFFDRLTDLITVRKDIGRLLKGKHISLLVTGTGDELPEGFEVPFRLTCDYFDMRFVTTCYWYTGDHAELLTANAASSSIFLSVVFDGCLMKIFDR